MLPSLMKDIYEFWRFRVTRYFTRQTSSHFGLTSGSLQTRNVLRSKGDNGRGPSLSSTGIPAGRLLNQPCQIRISELAQPSSVPMSFRIEGKRHDPSGPSPAKAQARPHSARACPVEVHRLGDDLKYVTFTLGQQHCLIRFDRGQGSSACSHCDQSEGRGSPRSGRPQIGNVSGRMRDMCPTDARRGRYGEIPAHIHLRRIRKRLSRVY